MNQLIIDMPPNLQSWIDTRLAHGDYADVADYLRDLIRRDRERMDESDREDDADMRALVNDGIASGICGDEPEEVLRRVIADVSVPHG